MASYLSCVVFLACFGPLSALTQQPKIQVYTRYPVEVGKENTFHCYVDGFHPPKIDITLLKNDVPMEDVTKSDLSFSKDWTFQLLVSKTFIPDGKSEYGCKVVHDSLEQPRIVKWDQE